MIYNLVCFFMRIPNKRENVDLLTNKKKKWSESNLIRNSGYGWIVLLVSDWQLDHAGLKGKQSACIACKKVYLVFDNRTTSIKVGSYWK